MKRDLGPGPLEAGLLSKWTVDRRNKDLITVLSRAGLTTQIVRRALYNSPVPELLDPFGFRNLTQLQGR